MKETIAGEMGEIEMGIGGGMSRSRDSWGELGVLGLGWD